MIPIAQPRFVTPPPMVRKCIYLSFCGVLNNWLFRVNWSLPADLEPLMWSSSKIPHKQHNHCNLVLTQDVTQSMAGVSPPTFVHVTMGGQVKGVMNAYPCLVVRMAIAKLKLFSVYVMMKHCGWALFVTNVCSNICFVTQLYTRLLLVHKLSAALMSYMIFPIFICFFFAAICKNGCVHGKCHLPGECTYVKLELRTCKINSTQLIS